MTLSYQDNITQVYWQPLVNLLNPEGAKQQELSGFDDEFVDIVDYIIRITHRIWEQKNIGLCYRYYSEVCPVYTLGAYSEKVEEVVQNTLKTVAAFPDRSLIGENVIWKFEQDGSYYSSHLISSIMTNTGDSDFGSATNKTGRVTTIADCVCYENQIIKEWLVRDNSFLIAQLGIDLIDAAITFSKSTPNQVFNNWYNDEFQRVVALDHKTEITVSADNWSVDQFLCAWAQTLFNQKLFAQLHQFYHVAAEQQWPGGRKATGLAQISGTLIQWLAQCPDAKISIDHCAIVPLSDGSLDVAIRWTIAGHYTPHDQRLNTLKGERFLLLACSHLHISQQKIIKEITVFDEIALYANMIRAKGANIALTAEESAHV